MNQTKNRIREDKVAEHQTWIRENLWCKEHTFPRVDITCEECRKLMPLREKCDASFANSLNFIDELLKSQREARDKELVEKIMKLNYIQTMTDYDVGYNDCKQDIINLIEEDK